MTSKIKVIGVGRMAKKRGVLGRNPELGGWLRLALTAYSSAGGRQKWPQEWTTSGGAVRLLLRPAAVSGMPLAVDLGPERFASVRVRVQAVIKIARKLVASQLPVLSIDYRRVLTASVQI
jgi:hypothetical protein